jgi:hypothetical protein
VRLIQRALDLLGGDGGGREDMQAHGRGGPQKTRWKGHGLPASFADPAADADAASSKSTT